MLPPPTPDAEAQGTHGMMHMDQSHTLVHVRTHGARAAKVRDCLMAAMAAHDAARRLPIIRKVAAACR